MRRAARVDENHRQVVEALRRVGATVQSLAAVGKGVPDLLVGYRLKTYLLEVKNPKQPPSARRLTDDEERWHRNWCGAPVRVVHSVDEAFAACEVAVTHARDAGFRVEPDRGFDSADYRWHP